MSELILPDSRFEMPELFYPNRKPAGNLKIDVNNKIGNIISSSEGFVFLHNSLQAQDVSGDIDIVVRAGATTTIEHTGDMGIVSTSTINTNDGFTAKGFNISSWSTFSFFAIVRQEDFTGDERTIFRWATLDRGVSLSFMEGISGDISIRSLVETTGTSIWTTVQDVTFLGGSNNALFIGMVFDGALRHIYAGFLGGTLSLLRSDTATGDIISISDNNAFIVQGGIHTGIFGTDKQSLSITSKHAFSFDEAKSLHANPYQFLIPA